MKLQGSIRTECRYRRVVRGTRLLLVSALLLIGIALGPLSHADNSGAAVQCQDLRHQEFDFWLGDWSVFDAVTDDFVAFTRVQKILDGCGIAEHTVFFVDRFGLPSSGNVLTGEGVSVMDSRGWLMLYADNKGSSLVARGHATAHEEITLTTDEPIRNGAFVRGLWRRNPDGTVTASVFVRSGPNDTWAQSTSFVYRKHRGRAQH
jgi:hypothetical protein